MNAEKKNHVVRVRNLSVAYQKQPVLWNIQLDFPEGELIGIVGPNGAGKSTLLKSMMGLLPLLSGEVSFWGKPRKENQHHIAYVPQRSSVDWDFPATVLDVVMMGRYGKIPLFRSPGKKHRQFALECLDQMGMQDFAHRHISELSGGQQQRVFLARALAQEAKVYLMDEPFAGVDAATEEVIVNLLRKLREQGKTIFVVHHDLQSVYDYFDSVLLLNQRVVAFGKTAEVFTEDQISKAYGGRLNMLTQVGEKMVGQND